MFIKAMNNGAFVAWLWVPVTVDPHYYAPNLSSGSQQAPQAQEHHSSSSEQQALQLCVFSINTSLHVHTTLSTSSPNPEQCFLAVYSRDVGMDGCYLKSDHTIDHPKRIFLGFLYGDHHTDQEILRLGELYQPHLK